MIELSGPPCCCWCQLQVTGALGTFPGWGEEAGPTVAQSRPAPGFGVVPATASLQTEGAAEGAWAAWLS